MSQRWLKPDETVIFRDLCDMKPTSGVTKVTAQSFYNGICKDYYNNFSPACRTSAEPEPAEQHLYTELYIWGGEDQYASDPLVLRDSNGKFYGYFTANRYKAKRARYDVIDTICDNCESISEDVDEWYEKLF